MSALIPSHHILTLCINFPHSTLCSCLKHALRVVAVFQYSSPPFAGSMLLIEASILTLSLFSGLSSAQPTTLPSDGDGLQLINGQPLPDSWCSYDLDDVYVSTLVVLEAAYGQITNTTTNVLAARKDVKVCESNLSRLSQCATIGRTAFTMTVSIAAAIWAYSHKKDCSYQTERWSLNDVQAPIASTKRRRASQACDRASLGLSHRSIGLSG